MTLLSLVYILKCIASCIVVMQVVSYKHAPVKWLCHSLVSIEEGGACFAFVSFSTSCFDPCDACPHAVD